MFSDDPQRQAMMMLAAGLLSPVNQKGWGGFGQALGRGIQGGLLGYNDARANIDRRAEFDMRRKFQERELEAMDKAASDRDFMAKTAGQFFRPGNAPSDGMGPVAPPQFDPAGFGMALAQRGMVREAMPFIPKPQERKMAFAPDGTAVDMNAIQSGQNFAPKEKPKLPDGMELGPDGRPRFMPEYLAGKKQLAEAGRAQVTTNVMPPKEMFKDSLNLKKDFDGQPEVKGFKEVQSAWDQISTALQKPSPANDMAAATKFMKLLDPGSVVRESELMMAMQASGALDRFMNTADRVLKGHKLTPEQRKDFYTAGEALFNASKDRYGQTVEQYEGIAKQYGLDPQFVQNAKPRKSSGWSIQKVN